jgi:hypothetical protein
VTQVSVIVRGAYGAVLCVAPGTLIRLAGGRPDARTCGIGRVLGARHLAQAALSAARPTPAVLVLGAEVDLLHSASMLALGILDAPRRRIGLTDAVLAAAFAADELLTARRRAAGARPARAVGAPGSPVPWSSGSAWSGDLLRRRDALAGRLAARTVPRAFRPWLTGTASP